MLHCVGGDFVLCVALDARNTRARAACEGQERKRQSLLQMNLHLDEGGDGAN